MVEEVAGFGGDFFFIFVLVGDDDFAGFFSDLLVDLVAAFGKEVVRVGFGLGIFLSVFDFLGADLLIQTNKYHKKSNRTLILIMQPLELR